MVVTRRAGCACHAEAVVAMGPGEALALHATQHQEWRRRRAAFLAGGVGDPAPWDELILFHAAAMAANRAVLAEGQDDERAQ